MAHKAPPATGVRLRNDWDNVPPTIESRGTKPSISVISDETVQPVNDLGYSDWLRSIQVSACDISENKPLASEVTYTSVVHELQDRTCPSATNTQHSFLPLGQLLEILRSSVVGKILRQCFHDRAEADVDKMVSKVYVNGVPRTLKILGTLMIIEKPHLLEYFTSNGVTDDFLPLQLQRRPVGTQSADIGRFVLKDRHGNALKALDQVALRSWSDYGRECFVSYQMRLCAPVFSIEEDSGKIFHYELSPTAILPFRVFAERKVRTGGFGTVTQVQIDPSHLLYPGTERLPTYFAIKTLHRHDASDLYPTELDALSRRVIFAQRSHKNVSRLLFSFKQGDRFSLALEWAEGNLEDLWKSRGKDFRPRNYKQSCWFFEQCLGLAIGLFGIHNLRTSFRQSNKDGSLTRVPILDMHGRHGDIKPSNILYYPCEPQGSSPKTMAGPRLVLADLGCAQFSTPETKSHGRISRVQGLTPAYRAPESETKRVFGQKYDIWALGCVFLEHAAVFLEANEANDDHDLPEFFSEERINEDLRLNKKTPHLITGNTFFRLCKPVPGTEPDGFCQAVPKDAVTDRITRLKIHENCSPAMREFLNHIQTGMLVTDPNNRLNAAQLKDHLLKIKDKCEEDEDYVCPPGIRDIGHLDSPKSQMERDTRGMSRDVVVDFRDSTNHYYVPRDNPFKRWKREPEVPDIVLPENADIETPPEILAVEMAIQSERSRPRKDEKHTTW